MEYNTLIVYVIFILFELMILIYGIIYMRAHSLLISISEARSGVILNTMKRYSITNNKPYKRWIFLGKLITPERKFTSISDPFMRHPLPIKYEDVKNCIVVTEGMPFIGVRYTLELVKTEKVNDKGEPEIKYVSWKIPLNIEKTGFITNQRVIIIQDLRSDIDKMTDTTTQADMLMKMLVPMALVMLAIIMIIFFGKMYELIVTPAHIQAQAAGNQWTDILTKLKPIG